MASPAAFGAMLMREEEGSAGTESSGRMKTGLVERGRLPPGRADRVVVDRWRESSLHRTEA